LSRGLCPDAYPWGHIQDLIPTTHLNLGTNSEISIVRKKDKGHGNKFRWVVGIRSNTQGYKSFNSAILTKSRLILCLSPLSRVPDPHMGWLWLVGSIKLLVSFVKEPYKRDNILRKRPIISSILRTVATPWDHDSQYISSKFSWVVGIRSNTVYFVQMAFDDQMLKAEGVLMYCSPPW